MRTLLAIAILFLTAAPVFAQPDEIDEDFIASIPEPGIISLIGIGALALLVGRRGKK